MKIRVHNLEGKFNKELKLNVKCNELYNHLKPSQYAASTQPSSAPQCSVSHSSHNESTYVRGSNSGASPSFHCENLLSYT